MAAKVKQTQKDAIAYRRRKAAELRLQHLTLDEIATALGVSKYTASTDLAAVRAEWAERRSASYEEWVGEELAKLDRLERTLLPAAIQGDYPAVDRIMSLMDRRARMLGLDKPQLHEHTVITMDAVESEIRRLEAELAGNDVEHDNAK